MTITIDIAANIATVREEITKACASVQRHADSVTLVAVSKRKPTTDILNALSAGVTHLGENRVEEAQEKIPFVNDQASKRPTWHMIGTVQRRKAKFMPALFDVVETVDSVQLAERLSRIGIVAERRLPVLLEINVSGEASKHGFNAHGWQKDAQVQARLFAEMAPLFELPGIGIRGLMTMAPFYDNMEDTRPVFASLASLRDALQIAYEQELPDLSMGMTNDYPVAIQEGATIVRIGRAIFGPRD